MESKKFKSLEEWTTELSGCTGVKEEQKQQALEKFKEATKNFREAEKERDKAKHDLLKFIKTADQYDVDVQHQNHEVYRQAAIKAEINLSTRYKELRRIEYTMDEMTTADL
jgi:hypothetical protein